jgi:hypothetical protein
MTLIVAVTGSESIWLLADRRLSRRGCRPKDDARKIMFLETTDGVAILGYAGLGMTGNGAEPADWMSRVLRGRNLSLEQSLGVLAKAVQRQFPQHLNTMPVNDRQHFVVAPAFLRNEPRLYTIGLALAPDQTSYAVQYKCHWFRATPECPAKPNRLVTTGSGAFYLMQSDQMRDKRDTLIRLVRASDRGKVSPGAVADHLATLNHDVHLAMPDHSVGHRCTVAWRSRRQGIHRGATGNKSYTGPEPDTPSSPCKPPLATISTGWDMVAFGQALLRGPLTKMMKAMQAREAGEPCQWPDNADIEEAVASLSFEPDEDLR